MEDQAGTCEARLGFLKFGDVERRDVEAAGFYTRTCARERRRKNDCFSKAQGVGGVWFGGIDVNPIVAGEGRGIEPGTVGEKRIVAEAGYGGFEVQAAGHGHGDDLVVVRREYSGELADAFGVAPLGEADEKSSINAENVAALERAGKHDMLKIAEFGKGLRERGGFRAARLRAERKNDGELIENDGGILDEHGVGEIRLGGERNKVSAEIFEKLLVGMMLSLGDLEIDRLALNEAQFAIHDSWTNGASDGCEHFAMPSLHEKLAQY